MTDTCHDIAPLLATLADDQADPTRLQQIHGHLATCSRCQASLHQQQAVHRLLRARATTLQGQAPGTLRARLAEQVASRASHPGRSRRWALARLPVAATFLLAFLGVLSYGLTSTSSTVLAAQLTLDHFKCVSLTGAGHRVDVAQAERDWTDKYDWTPRMPAAPAAGRGSLIAVRRCLYGHGHLAHLLYRIDGHVVSLFVMPRHDHPASAAAATHALFGQQARVWADADQTFALVGDVTPAALAGLAEELRAAE